MRMRRLAFLFPLLLLTVAGCAGGGRALQGPEIGAATPGSATGHTETAALSARPTKAIVKLHTTGKLPAQTRIGGVSATLSYASGKGLSIAPENVTVSGAGVGSTLMPNTNMAGQVVLGLIDVQGIAAGEFATLSFDVADGKVPTAADFTVAGAKAIDTATQGLAGIEVSIASVTMQ